MKHIIWSLCLFSCYSGSMEPSKSEFWRYKTNPNTGKQVETLKITPKRHWLAVFDVKSLKTIEDKTEQSNDSETCENIVIDRPTRKQRRSLLARLKSLKNHDANKSNSST